MAGGPGGAWRPREEPVIWGLRTTTAAAAGLAAFNVSVRGRGDLDGDPIPHLFVLLSFLACISGSVLGVMGTVPPSVEISLHAALFRIAVNVYGCYVSLVPGCEFDEMFGLVVCPVSEYLVDLMSLWCAVELGQRLDYFQCLRFLQYLPPACSVLRALRVSEGLPTLTHFALAVGFVHISMVGRLSQSIKASFGRLRHNIKDEVTRTKAALGRLEQSKAELESVSHGMSRMLTALCDVVVYLDADLCIQTPSGQLQEFLVPSSSGSARDLEGTSLLDFVDSEEDRTLVRTNLGARESASPVAASGAAGAFSIGLRNAGGSCVNVQIFYVRVAAGDGPSSLLGLNVGHSEPPAVADATPVGSMLGEAVDLAGASPPDPTKLSVAPDEEGNPSTIAIHFDAGSEDFRTIGHCPLLGPPKDIRRQPQSLLHWVGAEALEDFEDWVLRSVQSAPWDKAGVSEPFPAPLELSLPKVEARQLRASKAWLEVAPPDDDGDIEATLFLEGVTIGKRRRRGPRSILATVQEAPNEMQSTSDEDDDSASGSSSSMSSAMS